MEVVNKRVAAAAQTRANLIEAGLVLAEDLGLEGAQRQCRRRRRRRV